MANPTNGSSNTPYYSATHTPPPPTTKTPTSSSSASTSIPMPYCPIWTTTSSPGTPTPMAPPAHKPLVLPSSTTSTPTTSSPAIPSHPCRYSFPWTPTIPSLIPTTFPSLSAVPVPSNPMPPPANKPPVPSASTTSPTNSVTPAAPLSEKEQLDKRMKELVAKLQKTIEENGKLTLQVEEKEKKRATLQSRISELGQNRQHNLHEIEAQLKASSQVEQQLQTQLTQMRQKIEKIQAESAQCIRKNEEHVSTIYKQQAELQKVGKELETTENAREVSRNDLIRQREENQRIAGDTVPHVSAILTRLSQKANSTGGGSSSTGEQTSSPTTTTNTTPPSSKSQSWVSWLLGKK